jgi:hypothetical protein
MIAVLTVLFDDPFWVAVLERFDNDTLQVARFVFGAEPSLPEIFDFVTLDYRLLTDRLSPAVAANASALTAVNPKRRQRQVRQEIETAAISTQSQEALRLLREADKAQKATQERRDREQEKQDKYARKLEKRKQKQRGH